MKEGLEKLIRRVILKKYPWIKDFNVGKNKDNNFSWTDTYGVTYHIDYRLLSDEYLKDGDDGYVVFNNLRSETKHLYDILGPSPSDGFVGVTFKTYKGQFYIMKEPLEKIIRRIIVPKCPWIKDFKISVTKNGEHSLYNVRYYIDGNIYDSLFEGDEYGLIEKLTNIESETENLFNVLGPNKYDMFGVVRSYRYNKD